MARKPSSHKLPNLLAETLRDLTAWLEAEKIPQTIIGGVAVALLAQPRVTQDIDAVILLDTDSLESFLQTGSAYGFVPRISDVADFARTRRVILLQHQLTGVTVDLSCGVLPFENELVARAHTDYWLPETQSSDAGRPDYHESRCASPKRHRRHRSDS